MRILIVTAGSRGDVAPFTGLGRRLQAEGHDVAIATHASFAALVRGADLEYRSLPGDPVEMARERTAAPSPEAGLAIFTDYLLQMGEGLAAPTGGGTDLILTAFGPAAVSRTVAEAFGIPSIGVYLVPSVPTTAFPLPGWPVDGDLGPAGNLEAGTRLLAGAAALNARVLPPLRDRLGLAPDPTGASAGDAPPGWPIVHGFSPTVVPRPDDWPANVQVGGYWWPAPNREWEPSDELVAFLADGPPPVFLGFGSMLPGEGAVLTELVADAIERAGVRAVVQAGWAGLAPAGVQTLVVGDVPHEWLFPRMAAVVHHAGAGTTGAALRAGVPAVAVPIVLDQPFWAARLTDLGVAPPPVPHRELTAEALAAAIQACLDDPRYRTRAREVAARIATEDGAAAVLTAIDNL